MTKAMRIGIDARMISHSGVGTYISNLLRELPAVSPPHFEFVLFGSSAAFKNLNGSYASSEFRAPIYSLSEQIGFMTRTPKVDLWHAPHYNIPMFSSSELVVTVHDLIPLIFSGKFFSSLQKYYFITVFKKIARQAKRIIAVSQNTKRDILRYFKVPEDRIKVVYEGVSHHFHPINDSHLFEKLRRRYGMSSSQKFILYVGLLKPHKNLKVLIETVRTLRRQGKIDEKLVIVGIKSKSYPIECRYLEEIHSDEDVFYFERVDYEELPLLYSMASIFILPSLYEGFGLPVLEALACGTPVIVSNRASLPEVVGDAALTFEAESPSSLAEAIMKIKGDSGLRQELKEKGIRRAREFSWTAMARETVKVYQEVLTNR